MRAAQWHRDHRDLVSQRRRKSRQADLEAARARERTAGKKRRATPGWQEYQRQWREANREALNAVMRRHRARYPRWSRRSTDAETVEYLKILLSDPCGLCGSRESLEIDHIVPRSADGTNCWTNLAVLCRSCNASKNDKPLLLHMALSL